MSITARPAEPERLPPDTKRCEICNTVQSVSEYWRNMGYHGHLSPYCRTCSRKMKQKSPPNPDEITEVAADVGRKIPGIFDVTDLYEAWYSGQYATVREVAREFGLNPAMAGRMLRASGRATK